MSEPENTDDNRSDSVIQDLFTAAKKNGGIEYIFTLVRVDGLSYRITDPLIKLRADLSAVVTESSDDQLLPLYSSLTVREEPLELIANLLNCVLKQPYNLRPFIHLNTGTFPNIVHATPSQRVKELVNLATKAGRSELVNLIQKVYVDEVLSCCQADGLSPSPTLLHAALKSCLDLLTSLVNFYFSERLRFKDEPRIYKLPQFEVLELLVNDEYGLFGLHIHFSNGQRARFARNSDSTECTNVIPGPPVNFWVGPLEELQHEWRIGDKRLYEVGLPGRYNKLGEWKPLIYPGKWDGLTEAARSYSKDDDVQGCIFYMMCTGHKVIEFVVRTNIDLPSESVSLGESVHSRS